jgi:hypothetical protein
MVSSSCSSFGPEFGRAVEAHEVELHVLARGQVEVARGVLVGEVGQAEQLLHRYAAEGQFDAHHLYAGLPLPVYAPHQAQAPELLVGDAAFPVQFDFFLQVEDVTFDDGVLQLSSEALHVFDSI